MTTTKDIEQLLIELEEYFQDFSKGEELYFFLEIKKLQKGLPHDENLFLKLQKYFDERSDADWEQNDIDGRFIPNEQMKLCERIEEILK
jgi:hypothetical protein